RAEVSKPCRSVGALRYLRANGQSRSQREVKARAAVDLRLGPDIAAVAAHDAAHRCEADPGALEIGRAVQALEHAEEPIRKAHVEAGAVVAHRERRVAELRIAAEPDLRLGALAGVLPGVAEQVLEHH